MCDICEVDQCDYYSHSVIINFIVDYKLSRLETIYGYILWSRQDSNYTNIISSLIVIMYDCQYYTAPIGKLLISVIL